MIISLISNILTALISWLQIKMINQKSFRNLVFKMDRCLLRMIKICWDWKRISFFFKNCWTVIENRYFWNFNNSYYLVTETIGAFFGYCLNTLIPHLQIPNKYGNYSPKFKLEKPYTANTNLNTYIYRNYILLLSKLNKIKVLLESWNCSKELFSH